MDYSLAFSQCLRTAHNIGYDTVYNVCKDGTWTKVPWGVMEWVGSLIIVSIFAALAALIGAVIWDLLRPKKFPFAY